MQENLSAKVPSATEFSKQSVGKDVKVSRADLTNFLFNSSVSTDFMNKNSYEIQNFIKKKKKLFPE